MDTKPPLTAQELTKEERVRKMLWKLRDVGGYNDANELDHISKERESLPCPK